MGLTLAKVLGATSATSFQFAGETVNLTYRAAAVTPKLFADLAALGALDSGDTAAASSALTAMCDAIAALVATWDLALDDTGAPYPTDAASIAGLPFVFLLAVISAITGDLKPGEAPATSSDATPSISSSPQSSLAD